MDDEKRKEQDKPATVLDIQDASMPYSGTMQPMPAWKVNANIQAGEYSPAKQRAINEQWQQTKGRAMEYVGIKEQQRQQERQAQANKSARTERPQTQERQATSAKRRWMSRAYKQMQQWRPNIQARWAARNQPAHTQAAAHDRQGTSLRSRALNVFDRYGPTKRPEPAKAVTQSQTRPAPTAQTQQVKAPGKYQQMLQNAFDRHQQQRDNQPKQQQQKGKERGR